jgi:hypothetical protein
MNNPSLHHPNAADTAVGLLLGMTFTALALLFALAG